MEAEPVAVAAVPALSLAPSPAVTASFLALFDNDTAIPPDTMGAVGPDHVMTTLNSQVRIHSRTGATLATMSLNSFWSSLGDVDVFDPRLAYDPFNERWIFSAVANADSAAASVLVGVTATSDPTGNWYLYRIDVDPANGVWADFDALGFNKNWIVVSANIFRNQGKFVGVWFWVFDKANLYTNGAGNFSLFKSVNDLAFSVAPAQMHDNTLDTMYMVEDWDNAAGKLRISTITGPIGGEVLTIGEAFPTTTNRWDYLASDNFLPQSSGTTGIDAGDSRIESCVYRNGSLWASHTAFVPMGAPTRTVAQWWQFQPNGVLQQFGRVEDVFGGRSFAYPSLAVNASNDMLIGYSRFSASQYASANYAYRFATDPPNATRADTVLKAGESVYDNRANGLNRWGDYSATCVDPVDNTTMWTIQEYAGAGNRWGTHWGRIASEVPAVQLLRPADGISYPPSPAIMFNVSNSTSNKVEFFADGIKLGEDTTEPFTFTWNGAANGPHTLFAIAGVSTSAFAIINVGDPTSPVGVWETKLSGLGRGVALLNFEEDFTITGHGIVVGTFGLIDLTGAWGVNSRRQVVGSLLGVVDDRTVVQSDFLAKVKPGKLSVATTSFTGLKALKMKGAPLLPVPDLSGIWSGTFKATGGSIPETYEFAPSATHLNVFDFTADGPGASVTGAVLVTVSRGVGLATTNAPLRSLTGKLRSTDSISLKGVNNINQKINLKLTRP